MDENVLIAIVGGVTSITLAVVGILGPVILHRLRLIHLLANSNLDKANARLDLMLAEVKSLNSIIAEMRAPTTGPAVHGVPQEVTIVQPVDDPVPVQTVETAARR